MNRESDTLVVRPARPEDRQRIWTIRMSVTENMLTDPSIVADAEVDWYQEHAVFLVSETDGLVTGFVCLNHQTGYVWALFVHPDWQGQGHGTRLLDDALKRAARHGHRQAFLTTGATSAAADFYRHRGWRDMGRAFDGQAVFVRPLEPVTRS